MANEFKIKNGYLSEGNSQITGSLNVSGGITGSLFGTSSYAQTSSYATYAANGGVTQLAAGSGIILSPAGGTGVVTVSSTGGSLYNTATGSYGSFYDTGSVLATSATAVYSMSLSTTDVSNGVFVSASNGDLTRVKFTNTGVYNLQFSSQFSNTDNSNQDVVIWVRKNGSDITDSSGVATVPPFKAGSNGQAIAAWNYYLSLSANDYIQLCWHVEQANVITLETIAAGTSPTHPRTPSTILTATRVDTFLSNTGSFSGSFTGTLTGTASYATNALSASYAPSTPAFPYTGSALITGSLGITGSLSNGSGNIASGIFSHAEGNGAKSTGNYSHAEGTSTITIGQGSHAEGYFTSASGDYSHAEGVGTTSTGQYSHAEGYYTTATGYASHAEGRSTTSVGNYSHAEGGQTTANGQNSHAEGYSTTSTGNYSHAEGDSTTTTAFASHAEGTSTIAIGQGSHAEGYFSSASGDYSHAEGLGTNSSGSYQHVQGQYNILSSAQSAFILGNGTNAGARSNLIFASGSQVQITGSVIATSGFTGSLLGTSSYATQALSASYATTASYAINALSASFALTASSTPNAIITASISSNTITFTKGNGTTFPITVNTGSGGGVTQIVAGTNITLSPVGGTGVVTVNATGGGGAAFPYTGSAKITGSLSVTGSISNIGDQTISGSIYTNGTITFSGQPFISSTYPSGNIYISALNNGILHLNDDGGESDIWMLNGSNKLRIKGDTSITGSLSNGTGNIASGLFSHAEGESTTATGNYSHAEGYYTSASGSYSHAEGESTTATGNYSHAEGEGTTSTGYASHAEGANTNSPGDYSHAEGESTTSTGNYSHAEGTSTITIGQGSHAEGQDTTTGQLGYEPGTIITSGVFELDPQYGDLTSTFTAGVFVLIDDPDGQINGTPNIFKLEVASSTYTGTPATEITLVDTSINTSDLKYTVGIDGNFNPPLADAPIGDFSHTSGESTHTVGRGSSTEGYFNEALGYYQSVVGIYNEPINDYGAFIIGGGYDNTPRNLLVASPKNQIVTITGSATTYKPLTTQENLSATFTVSGEIVESANFDGAVILYDLISLVEGTWFQTDQTAANSERLLGIYIGDNKVLLSGYLTVNEGVGDGPLVDGPVKHGLVVYIQEAAVGLMDTTVPTADYVRTLGHILYANVSISGNWTMKFNPSNDWVKI